MGRLGAHRIGWGDWASLRASARNQANQGVCIYEPALSCSREPGAEREQSAIPAEIADRGAMNARTLPDFVDASVLLFI